MDLTQQVRPLRQPQVPIALDCRQLNTGRLKRLKQGLKQLRLLTTSMQLRRHCCQLMLDCTAVADPLVGVQLVLEGGSGDGQTLNPETLKKADPLVGVQLVLEGGGGNGLLPRDAARRAAHHVAHVHDCRDQLLAALRIRRPLRSRRGLASSVLLCSVWSSIVSFKNVCLFQQSTGSALPRIYLRGWLAGRKMEGMELQKQKRR